jgi:hypothetical protein
VGLSKVYIDTEKGAKQDKGAVPGKDKSELAVHDVPDLPAVPSPEPSGQPVVGTARRNFGPGGNGWMKIETAKDGSEALMRVLSFGGNAKLDRTTVVMALEQLYGICFGLKMDVISSLAAQAAAAPERVIRGRFSIAQAKPPPDGDIGRINYTFRQAVGSHITLPYKELRLAFAAKKLEGVIGRDLKVRPVAPGEELAVFVASEGGALRKDVFGREVPHSGAENLLKAGKHVELKKGHYISQVFGYVCLLDGVLSVIPPVWTSADHIEAHFVYFSAAGPRSELNWDGLSKALEAKRVRYGLRDDEIKKLIEKPITGDKAATRLIALGVPSQAGVDAHIEYTFNPEKQAGAFLSDGSIDLRERNEVVGVKEEQLLARISPASRGNSGVDLAGKEILGQAGKEQIFKAEKNVRIEYGADNAPRRFYAKVDGHVEVKGKVVSVHPVVYINGDVDYSLGNIESGKDVYIDGSVLSGFSIKAGGSVMVGGTVESGATIHAERDVVVSQGIVGNNTRVVALGTVKAKYVQNSTVMARGDITIGSYLHSAHVRAGGWVRVRDGGGERGASIVGGETFGARGVEARRLGSGSTDQTLVGIGPDPVIAAELVKLEKTIKICKAQILRIFRTLGVDDIQPAHFKSLIENSPVSHRKPLMKMLEQLKQMTDSRNEAIKQRQTLENNRADGLAALEVAEAAKPDLILLDVMMPGIDGFETCRRLKTIAETRATPVVFITARGLTEDIVEGFRAGGVDYITKPFRRTLWPRAASLISPHIRPHNDDWLPLVQRLPSEYFPR